jgi:hypothetical protein
MYKGRLEWKCTQRISWNLLSHRDNNWLLNGIILSVSTDRNMQTLEEQELLTLPEHLSSLLVFSGVRVTRSLVIYIYIYFVDRCLSFCTFSFGHCVVCSSSIYGFWLPLWYLQTLPMHMFNYFKPIYHLYRTLWHEELIQMWRVTLGTEQYSHRNSD